MAVVSRPPVARLQQGFHAPVGNPDPSGRVAVWFAAPSRLPWNWVIVACAPRMVRPFATSFDRDSTVRRPSRGALYFVRRLHTPPVSESRQRIPSCGTFPLQVVWTRY